MTSTCTPMTFTGQIVNLQIILGGSPTINNFPHPTESSQPAQPAPFSSRSDLPSASGPPRAPSAAQNHSTIPTPHRQHVSAAASILFSSPHPETSPCSPVLLSPIGSAVGNLNGLQAYALISHSSRKSNAAEAHVYRPPFPTAYARSNAGDARLSGYERIGNNLPPREGYTANAYGPTQGVLFPTPCLPPYSCPGPSVSHNVWSMPEPERFDWFIDEREEEDHPDEGYL